MATRPISCRLRAFLMGWALGVAVLAGTLIGGILSSGGGIGKEPSGELLVEALGTGVMASAPMTIPAGLIAGLLSVRALRRAEAGRTRRAWTLLGLRRGCTVGALVAAAYFGALALEHPVEGAPIVAMMAALGAVTGAVAGAAIGLCCARTARRIEVAATAAAR